MGLALACVGFIEIPDAITYMLDCYVSCFQLLTCLDNLEIFVLKLENKLRDEKLEAAKPEYLGLLPELGASAIVQFRQPSSTKLEI